MDIDNFFAPVGPTPNFTEGSAPGFVAGSTSDFVMGPVFGIVASPAPGIITSSVFGVNTGCITFVLIDSIKSNYFYKNRVIVEDLIYFKLYIKKII